MPTYEYACELCGHRLEIYQSILAERLTDCPSCLGSGLKRLIGRGAGIIFKGSGFYQTDYKGGEKKSDNGGEKTADSGKTGSGETSPAPSSGPSAAPAKDASSSNKSSSE
jgi:putative FmdB family regulatory protein